MQYLRKPTEPVINETKPWDVKIQAEVETSQTTLRQHSVPGAMFIRCYLQEL